MVKSNEGLVGVRSNSNNDSDCVDSLTVVDHFKLSYLALMIGVIFESRVDSKLQLFDGRVKMSESLLFSSSPDLFGSLKFLSGCICDSLGVRLVMRTSS